METISQGNGTVVAILRREYDNYGKELEIEYSCEDVTNYLNVCKGVKNYALIKYGTTGTHC